MMIGALPLSTSNAAPALPPAFSVSGGVPEGWQRGGALGTYIHAHRASNPEIPRAFVAACAAARDQGT
jgi:cobyrinic acid a,c-diamide synthase